MAIVLINKQCNMLRDDLGKVHIQLLKKLNVAKSLRGKVKKSAPSSTVKKFLHFDQLCI